MATNQPRGAIMIGTTAALIAFALARGVTITEGDASIALVKATDYINTFDWLGKVEDPETQIDAFPRLGCNKDEVIKPGDVPTTPAAVENAAMRLAMASHEGIDLMPSTSGKQVLEERVEGAVTVKYSELSIYSQDAYFPWWDSIVGRYLRKDGATGTANFSVGRG